MLQRKKWVLKEANIDTAREISNNTGISLIAAQILSSRGLNSTKQVNEFLWGSAKPFHAPQLLKGMAQAVERIKYAVENNEKITIYGDYDVDGITASSLLLLFFEKFGICAESYIPLRETEGYGLNGEAIKKIVATGTKLLLTVDCGISSVAEVANAPKGLDIIITDHHTPPVTLPEAYCVINPKQPGCAYPYKELSGVGVALKLCQGLWQSLKNTSELLTNNMDLVALGTIADIVHLTGENREIVRMGLAEINKRTNIGIAELINVAGLTDKRITAGHVSFMLAPRLNAAGRLANAQQGVRLLTTGNKCEAIEIAEVLDSENRDRQEIEKNMLVEAQAMIAAQGKLPNVLLLAQEGWHAGVIGIVASRLVDKYNRPTIMVSLGEETGKASCRSIPAFDMYDALTFAKEHLISYGGHKQAAGFSIAKGKIEKLHKSLLLYAKEHMKKEDYLPLQKVDVQLADLSGLDEKLLQDFSLLEPCGMHNPSPVLAVNNVLIKDITTIGGSCQHLKFIATKEGKSFTSLFWNKGSLKHTLYDDLTVAVAFVPEACEWRKEKAINLKLFDIKQEKELIDLRDTDSTDKDNYLDEILQNDEDALICISANQDIHTSQIESVVFTQPPYWLLGDFPEKHKNSLKKVYLLYNKKDIEKLLKKDQLGVIRLRELYKAIREENGVDKEKLFFDAGADFSLENALSILKEISVINEKDGKYFAVPLQVGQKMDLRLSTSYQMMLGGRDTILKCLRMSKQECAAVFFGSKLTS